MEEIEDIIAASEDDAPDVPDEVADEFSWIAESGTVERITAIAKGRVQGVGYR